MTQLEMTSETAVSILLNKHIADGNVEGAGHVLHTLSEPADVACAISHLYDAPIQFRKAIAAANEPFFLSGADKLDCESTIRLALLLGDGALLKSVFEKLDGDARATLTWFEACFRINPGTIPKWFAQLEPLSALAKLNRAPVDRVVSVVDEIPAKLPSKLAQSLAETMLTTVGRDPMDRIRVGTRLVGRSLLSNDQLIESLQSCITLFPEKTADCLAALLKHDAQSAQDFWSSIPITTKHHLSTAQLVTCLASGAKSFDSETFEDAVRLLSLRDMQPEQTLIFDILADRERAFGDADLGALLFARELCQHSEDVTYLLRVVRNGEGLRMWRSPDFPGFVRRFSKSIDDASRGTLLAVLNVLLEERGAAFDAASRMLRRSECHHREVVEEIFYSCGVFHLPIGQTADDTASRHDRFRALTRAQFRSTAEEKVLVLVERGANPSAIMAAVGDCDVTFCSMDDWNGKRFRDANRYQSLRDLFLNEDPLALELAYVTRQIAEDVVSVYSMQQSIALQSERQSFNRVPLATAIEDGLESNATGAFCLLRAIEAFEGDVVLLAVRDPALLDNFGDMLLGTGKAFFCSVTTANATEAFDRLARPFTPTKPPKPATATEVGQALRTLDQVSFDTLFENYPDVSPDTALIMGAFNDPIYRENIIPVLEKMLDERPVHVLEPLNAAHAEAALSQAFGHSLSDPKTNHRLSIINASQHVAAEQKKLKSVRAKLQHICWMALASMSETKLMVGRTSIARFVHNVLPKLFETVVLRLEVSMRLYDQLFTKQAYKALFVFSERLPIRISAVAVANQHNLRSINVMSVNDIRLPRYRPPKASVLTSIDTATSDFFEDYYGTPPNRIALTSSPRMDEILKRIENSDPKKTRDVLDLSDDRKVILYACQLQPIDRCISVLRQLVDVTENNPDVLLLVKLHRRENFAREQAYEAEVEFSSASDRIVLVRNQPHISDITNCIRVADVVVSFYSNALREAACVGVPIISADYFGVPLPFDYQEAGLGMKATSEADLRAKLTSLIETGPSADDALRTSIYLGNNKQLKTFDSASRIASLA